MMPAWTPWTLLTGHVGALKVGNQVAALVAKWTMVPGETPDTWAFTAHAHFANRFLMTTQTPDLLILEAAVQRWRWRGTRAIRLELGGDQVLRGTLIGAPDVGRAKHHE